MKCWNLDFCPSGPPEPRDGGECFAPLFVMSCFAQLRAKTCENDAQDALGKAKNQKFQLLGAPGDEHFRFRENLLPFDFEV